jgi:CheY-like chemotaxis protein
MARILIIDDNDDLRAVVCGVLESAGHEVIQAPNGVQGIELQRKSPVDLVITDILMPEKEGIETIRELAREFPALKIIAMSGAGLPHKIASLTFIAKEFGAHAFLSKPFEPGALLESVQEALKLPAG